MNLDTKPSPFNLGDHVRYTASKRLAAGRGSTEKLVLAPGMEGVIVLSTGALTSPSEPAPRPWHCRAQFGNGFQLDITPANSDDFEPAS